MRNREYLDRYEKPRNGVLEKGAYIAALTAVAATLGYAVEGAKTGTVVAPGWGTAIGGLTGLAIGLCASLLRTRGEQTIELEGGTKPITVVHHDPVAMFAFINRNRGNRGMPF